MQFITKAAFVSFVKKLMCIYNFGYYDKICISLSFSKHFYDAFFKPWWFWMWNPGVTITTKNDEMW